MWWGRSPSCLYLLASLNLRFFTFSKRVRPYSPAANSQLGARAFPQSCSGLEGKTHDQELPVLEHLLCARDWQTVCLQISFSPYASPPELHFADEETEANRGNDLPQLKP